MLHPKDGVSHIRGENDQNCPSVCFPVKEQDCVCVFVAFMIYDYRIYMRLDFGGLSFSFVVRYFPQRVNARLTLRV